VLVDDGDIGGTVAPARRMLASLLDGLVTSFAVSGGGTDDDSLNAVAAHGAGGVVAAGVFRSSMATFGGVVMSSAGDYDAVLWKMNAEGTTLWAGASTRPVFSST
jgi:hypothetical protein